MDSIGSNSSAGDGYLPCQYYIKLQSEVSRSHNITNEGINVYQCN